MSRRGHRSRPFRYAALVALAILFAFPFYWMFVTSVEPRSRLSDIPPNMLPLWDWQNYADAWNAGPWGRYFLNTVFVASAATALALITSVLAGFAFGTMRSPSIRGASRTPSSPSTGERPGTIMGRSPYRPAIATGPTWQPPFLPRGRGLSWSV
jgi:ABC-type spermidine/putrescine transport system permease subunit II